MQLYGLATTTGLRAMVFHDGSDRPSEQNLTEPTNRVIPFRQLLNRFKLNNRLS
jgi:hypothetical protein